MSSSSLYLGMLIACCCVSCQNFVFRKDTKEELLKEEWNTLDMNIVDQPPLFENCRGTIESALDSCFQHTIIHHIQEVVPQKKIWVQEALKDTLWLPIHIDTKGEVTLEEFSMPVFLETQFPEFKNTLKQHLTTLPEVTAAHSRGVSVSTTYRLPIVLQSE